MLYERSASLISRSALLSSAAIVAWLVLPHTVLGQTCVGSPTIPGQFALGGNVSFSDGATGFGAEGRANLDGPLSVGAGIGIIDIDNVDSNVTTLSGGLAYDLPVEGFAACPTAGVGYSTWSDTSQGVTFDLSEVSFPLGLSVGTQLGEEDSVLLLPSAAAGLFYYRLTGSISGGGESVSDTESETEFFVGGGATLLLGQIFLRGGVSTTTVENSDATINLGLGIVF